MVPPRPAKKKHEVTAERAIAGVLALLIEEREQRVNGDKNATKIEVLLDERAGFSHEDTAVVTGKTPDAVRKVIERGRGK